MDANTLGWIMFGSGIMLTWIALKTVFFGIKIMTGIWWFIIFMYLKTNVPVAITEGGPVHTGLLVVSIGIGLMVVLSGLGIGIKRSQKWNTLGDTEETEGFKWKLPDWMKFSEDNAEERSAQVGQNLEEYRMRLRKAYRTGEFSRRGRR